jgi:hypothetical protein
VKTFAFEGRFPASWLIAGGLLVAGLFVFLTVKERRYATRPGWLWWLLGLRGVVLMLVLWALAGPTDVLEDNRTKPKGFWVFVDSSASMTIADAGDGTGNVTRWQDALRKESENEARVLLDQALGALSGGRAGLLQFTRIAVDKNDEDIAREEGGRVLENVNQAMDACLDFLDQVDGESGELEDEEQARLFEVREFLQNQLVPEITKLDVEQAGTTAGVNDAIRDDFRRADRSLRMLADEVNSRYEEAFIGMQQATASSDAEGTRMAKVMPWVEALEEEWIVPQEEVMRVSRFTFSGQAVPISSGSWQKYLVENEAAPEVGTDLGSVIDQAAREAAAGRLHAGILVTDGAHNTDGDPRNLASALAGIPFAIVPIGDARFRRDLFLHHIQYAKSLIHKDVLSVDAKITAHACEGEKVVVELLEGDEVKDRKMVTIRTQIEDHRVNLKWRATELGVHEFQLRIVPVDDEFTEENNSEMLQTQVIDDEMRVFLADDLPRWEFRYLLNLFKRDPKVISESALFSPQHVYPNRRDRPPVPRLPESIEEWRRFRVVILGDLTQDQFTAEQQKMVKQYLIEGGNLIVIAGENAMPQKYAASAFGDLLPVDFGSLSKRSKTEGFTLNVVPGSRDVPPVQLASNASASAKLWRSISASVPVYDLSPCSVPKPTANVLIEAVPAKGSAKNSGERRAFLSWQYVGRGRVVYASAPAIHKLRYRHGDRYHYRFWGQMLRWIVVRDLAGGSKSVSLTTDKSRYAAGARVQATLRLTELDGQPVSREEVTLIAQSGERVVSRIEMKPDKSVPGEYHCVLVGLPSGPIMLKPEGSRIDTLLRREKFVGELGAEIAIDPHDSIEMRDPLCNTALLGAIADASGGTILSPVAAREFLKHLDLDPRFEQRSEREALWSSWWLLLTVCLLLLIEWIGRKAAGLV